MRKPSITRNDKSKENLDRFGGRQVLSRLTKGRATKRPTTYMHRTLPHNIISLTSTISHQNRFLHWPSLLVPGLLGKSTLILRFKLRIPDPGRSKKHLRSRRRCLQTLPPSFSLINCLVLLLSTSISTYFLLLPLFSVSGEINRKAQDAESGRKLCARR